MITNQTHIGIKESTDWFVVTDGEGGVAGVGPLGDLVSSMEDPVTPCWRTMLLTGHRLRGQCKHKVMYQKTRAHRDTTVCNSCACGNTALTISMHSNAST